MDTLVTMLKQSQTFAQIPYEKQVAFARLAHEYDDNDLTIYLSPAELADTLGVGSRQLWTEFLQLETVKQYIKGQMAQIATVASRKGLQTLTKAASTGDTQAVKQINELAGILDSSNNNKTIVLHQIQRTPVPSSKVGETDDETV